MKALMHGNEVPVLLSKKRRHREGRKQIPPDSLAYGLRRGLNTCLSLAAMISFLFQTFIQEFERTFLMTHPYVE